MHDTFECAVVDGVMLYLFSPNAHCQATTSQAPSSGKGKRKSPKSRPVWEGREGKGKRGNSTAQHAMIAL